MSSLYFSNDTQASVFQESVRRGKNTREREKMNLFERGDESEIATYLDLGCYVPMFALIPCNL